MGRRSLTGFAWPAACISVTMLWLGGCTKRSEPVVYIDLERVFSARLIAPEQLARELELSRVPEEKIAAPEEVRYVLEPLTSSPGFQEELEVRRRMALEAARRLRLEMEQELRDAASLRVAREVERYEPDLIQRAEEEAAEAYTRLSPRMRALAEEYARKRAPLLIRRAVLSAEAGNAPIPESWKQELRLVTEELSRLEAEQASRLAELSEEAELASSVARRNVKVSLNEFAHKRVREELAAIEEKLRAEDFGLRSLLPETPLTPEISTIREVLVLDAVRPRGAKPRVAKTNPRTWAAREWASLWRQAELWARAKGYRLSSYREGGKDVTDQFLAEFAP